MSGAMPETRNQRAFRDGYLTAAEVVMHFINALDSSEMDANAVRSAIYHKCLEMRPPQPLDPKDQ
jgi:hypothetical protein